LTFATVPLQLQRRVNDRIAPLLQFPDKKPKTGRKRGAIHTRKLDRNWDLIAPWQGAQIPQPPPFIAGQI